MKLQKAKWDGKRIIKLTPRYVRALKELVHAEMDMMRKQDRWPGSDEAWQWGRATITDLSKINGVEFDFGGPDEKPKMLRRGFQLIVE